MLINVVYLISLLQTSLIFQHNNSEALCFFLTQVKFDVSGRELVIPLSDDQHDGDEDEGYAHEVIQRMLAAKDEGLVSAEAYHKLRMALLEKVQGHVLPLSVIKQERRSQNKEIRVIQIPEIN